MILSHPGLRLLAKRKLRGVLRKQKRRLKRPSGIAFGVIGILLFALWIASIVLGQTIRPDSGLDASLRLPLIQLGGLVFCLMTLSGSLNHRGLYLPKEEIEFLFSAPVTRSDLVRYRMLTNVFRALLGSLVVGLLVMWRMPIPPLAFLGIFVAIQTLPIAGQAVSLLAGSAENKLFTRVPRGALLLLNIAGAVVLWVLFMSFALGSEKIEDKLLDVGFQASLEQIIAHPWLKTISLPFRPWALMISAETPATFLLWFAVSVSIWFVMFELTARIPVDYRELSLQTSADVARRLNRMRRGGMGASASRVSRRTVGWRVPWLFGRGPLGALTWRKTTAMLRKARGTLIVSTLIIAFLTVLTSFVGRSSDDAARVLSPVLLVLIGTVYLSGGLRFDFRDDLDQMETIKTWPLSPGRLFLANILSQVALITGLLYVALAARALIAQDFNPWQLVAIPIVPLVVVSWAALDNAVFLYAPVRFLPGQEGALQHMGRTMVMMFLRLLVFVVIAATVALTTVLPKLLGLPDLPAVVLGSLLGFAVLLVEVSALVVVGGRLFRRFDVARDRP